MAQEASQYEISNPPRDGISSVKWFNHSNNLIVTSWDKTVSIYNITSGSGFDNNDELKHRYSHSAGVLDCTISSDDLTIYSVGCDNKLVSLIGLGGSQPQNTTIGSHNKAIRCIEYISSTNMIITGSWDKTIKLWSTSSPNTCISTHNLPNKVFAMSYVDNKLVCGISGRRIYIYDIRNMSSPLQTRESSLKHQTRNIVCHPLGEQFIVSSIEGRVSVEYFNPSKEIQSKKYAFKCHRLTDKISGIQTIYPVNAITFHPQWKTFATGGGDGVVNIWDGRNKKRICQFPPYNTSISSLDFNNNGNLISIASSYTWEHGDKGDDKPNDAIWIRKVRESEAKPKIKSNKNKNKNKNKTK